MSRTAEVLLKLLERVPDSNKLGVLLETENLFKLLQANGWDKGAIRQALKSGKLPGDLLLELLDKEPDPDRLLAQIGITNVEPAKKQVKLDPLPTTTPSAAPQVKGPVNVESVSKPPKLDQLSATTPTAPQVKGRGNLFGDRYGIVVLALIAVTCVFPAMGLSKFLPNVDISVETAMIIAFVGGAIAGAISDRNAIFSWKGMIIGIVYSLGTLGATYLYTRDRAFIFRIEIAIPLLLGGIPALIVYFVLSRLTKPA